MDIDTENFIAEVHKRPALWDTKCPEFSDKNVKQRDWDELADIYGAELSTDEKKQLAKNLKTKWINIRNCFVKTHKANKMQGKEAEKKQVEYEFYNKLLFLEDTVKLNTTSRSLRRQETKLSKNTESDEEAKSRPIKPKRNRSNKKMDQMEREIFEVINKKFEKQNLEEDEDRLFMLSLVKEFKKIPEDSQLQAKLGILHLIQDAQLTS